VTSDDYILRKMPTKKTNEYRWIKNTNREECSVIKLDKTLVEITMVANNMATMASEKAGGTISLSLGKQIPFVGRVVQFYLSLGEWYKFFP